MGEKCHFCEHERGPLMGQSEICSSCHDFSKFQVKKRMSPKACYEYEILKKEEEWINDQSIEFDRNTALEVLKSITKHMRPSLDLFGNKTLVINRYRFEAVRKKFLDGRPLNNAAKQTLSWISVKDRLPEATDYLDCMLVLKVGDSYVIDHGGWMPITRWDEKGNAIKTWDWWTNNDWDEGQGCSVQYWMPYPSLPKEIEQKTISLYEYTWEKENG